MQARHRLFTLALAGLLASASASAAVDPTSACDVSIFPSYVQWAASTTGAPATATAPTHDTSFPGVTTPGTYFAQGKQLLKFRSSDGVKQWAWCPPNITSCTSAQGASTINNAPVPVPLSNPGLHGCAATPCVFVFLGGSDGFLYRLDAATGTIALSADTRRKVAGAPACATAPGDAINATPAVVLYAFADTTPGSRGRVFRDDVDATPGHAGDDVVIVITADGCGDTTRNRIIAYWAKDLSPKWTFNADGEVKMDRGIEGCTIDYAAMRLYCGTDLPVESTGQSSLFTLDIITGALLWSTNAGAILNRPTLNSDANVLYVANKAGALMAYDPAGHLGGAAPLWSSAVTVARPGTFISKSPDVQSRTGVWQNRILALDSGGTLHAIADCDLANAPAGCAADGMLLWSRSAFGAGISFKSRPIVLPGTPSRAFIGRNDGYIQMLELTDTDLAYKGIVTASPAAPNNAEVYDPSFDEGDAKITVVSGTQINRLQRAPELTGTGDPDELFCTVVPYGNALCTVGGIGGNSCNRPQFDQYNPCLLYTCNTSGGNVCQKVTTVKPTGQVPDGVPCNDEWSGAPKGPQGTCTSSTLRNNTVTDSMCASSACPGCLPNTAPPYFLGKSCTTNTDCWPCRTAAGTPVNTTNQFCRCPAGPLVDPIPCNVPGTGVCVCNSASMSASVTNAEALALCNDACIAGTCAKDTYSGCACLNAGDLGCGGGTSCCGALSGGCVDLLNDPAHCGDCSNDCNTYFTPGVPCVADSQCTDQESGTCSFAVTSFSCASDVDCTNQFGPNAKCNGGICYTGTCRYLTQAGTCVQGVCADWPECPGPSVSELANAGIKGVDALAYSRANTCDAFVTTYRTSTLVPDAPCGPACASDAVCGGGDCTNGFCCPAGKSCVSGTCKYANVQSIASGGTVGHFTIDGDVSRMHGVGVLRSGTTAFASFVNDPVSAGTAGLAVARGTTYSHPLPSGATVGAVNEPFAATEFNRGPVGPAVDTAVSTDTDWAVYFGNLVGGGCTDKHICKITGNGSTADTPVAVPWLNQPCVEPLPGDGMCLPTVDVSPERITALAFGQLEYSPPNVFHRYLVVAHGTTISFLDLDGGIPAQKDIDLTNRNIYDPTTPSAVARGESPPVSVLGIAIVPYGDLVIEVRGSNGNRFLLNVDAHDKSCRHQRVVQRGILGVHPCAAGGICPSSATCVQGACLPNCGACPDGTTCTLIGGGTCELPGGGGTPVCCIDNAVPNNFGTTDGRLSVMPDGQLLRFVPSINAPAANWKVYQLTRADACTGTTSVVNDSVRVSRVGADAEVSWTDSPGSFNVYRGSVSGAAWSYNHTCFASMVPGPVTDVDVPPPGTAAYYLVSRVTGCGESSLGEGRPNPSPCR